MLRTDYPELYAQISSNYGAVDGTHFTLPDLANKFARGAAGTPTVGGGSDTHSHTDGTLVAASHTHASAAHVHGMGAHTHDLSTSLTGGSGSIQRVNASSTGGLVAAANTGSTTPGATGAAAPDVTGTTDPASNVPAYTEVKYIIKI